MKSKYPAGWEKRDFKIRDYRRLDARSPMSGGLDRVRSVVACCGAKTQIKLLHYQLRTKRNCSSRIHFEDVFPKSQRWAYLLFCWWNSRWGRVCFALRCLQVANSIYPYWEYDEFSLDSLSSDECLADFRVEKDDIPRRFEGLPFRS